MRDRLKKVAKILAYVSFYFWAFVFALYVTFPYERVKARIIHEVETREVRPGVRQPTGMRLEIDELGPSWFTGVEIEGARLSTAATERAEDDEDAPPPAPPLVVHHAIGRVSLLSLLTGGIGGSLDAELAGGALEGTYEESSSEREIHAHVEGLRMASVPMLGEVMPLPLTGRMDADIDLVLPEDPRGSTGAVNITLRDLVIGDGHAKMPIPRMADGLTIDPISAGNVSLRANVADGRLRVSRLVGDGEHLETLGQGEVILAHPVERSRIDLMLRLAFTDEYRESSPRTGALFSLVSNNPIARRALASEGVFQFRLRGSATGGVRTIPAGSESMDAAAE